LPDSCPLSGKLDDAIAPGDVTIKMYSEIASRIVDIGTLLASSSDDISVLIPLKNNPAHFAPFTANNMSSLQNKDQHQQEALEQAEAEFWNTANNKLIRYGGKWTHKIIVEAEGTVMKVR
jgi:hypothetical protein